MTDSQYNEMRAASWRRKLTVAEEAEVQTYLAARPQEQAVWEDDLALTRHLAELPDAPLSSNFTSLVLQALDAERISESRPAPVGVRWSGWWRRFAPRLALVTLAATLGVGGLFNYERQMHARKRVAEGVERFVDATYLPGPAVFEEFDTIQQLQQVSTSTDEDLLAALQ